MKVIDFVDLAYVKETPHEGSHIVMQRFAPCYNDADRNRPVGVQPFKIFEITIVEWVFVVPLDLKRDPAEVWLCAEAPHVVDLMGLALPLHAVDAFLDHEGRLNPIFGRERSAYPLRPLSLAATARDNLLNRNGRVRQSTFELY